MPSLDFVLVDVFSSKPFTGNSLPVFLNPPDLTAEQMLRITQELRHFESIFLYATTKPRRFRVRVFDLFEELPFAGHPIIGAAASMAAQEEDDTSEGAWFFELRDKTVSVNVEKINSGYFGWLNQGRPEFFGEVEAREAMAAAFSLKVNDLNPNLPIEIVSTGLRYMILPVRSNALPKARIAKDLTELLQGIGAQFAVLLDETNIEVRHWNNDGILEDIATGSAAGTIGAYRLKHGLTNGGETFTLHQGRFTGRPSRLKVKPEGMSSDITTVFVGGEVAFVGSGQLDHVPGA